MIASKRFENNKKVDKMFWGKRRPIIRNTGVYIDAFNVYYGARDICGRGTSGWRWLNLIKLTQSIISSKNNWGKSQIVRAVYCTALRHSNPSSLKDQKQYIKALEQDPRMHIELGQYNSKRGKGILSRQIFHKGKYKNKKVFSPGSDNFPPWFPGKEIREPNGDISISVNYHSYEEKGSDVNLAAHVLIDFYEKRIDSAVIISNDGDLRFPLAHLRNFIPIAVINPSARPTSQMLKGLKDTGVGNHWWHTLKEHDFRNNQFDTIVGELTKPQDW